MNNLSEQFFGLIRLMHRANWRRGAFRGQGRVLALLAKQSPISQRELGFILGMRPQSLGELLAKLESRQLVVRTQKESDRRALQVELTPNGVAEAAAQSVAPDDPWQVLTLQEQEVFGTLLTKLADSWRASIPDDQCDDDDDTLEHPHICRRHMRHMHRRGGFGHHHE